MTLIKFDPTKSRGISNAQLNELLSLPGIHSPGESRLLARDRHRAAELRWDVNLEIYSVRLPVIAAICSQMGLGRMRLVGATWDKPWEVTDRLMLKRLKHHKQLEERRDRLSRTTRERLSFV